MGAVRYLLVMFLSFPLKSQGSQLYYLPGYDIAPAMLVPPVVQATSGCACKEECMARADCTAVSVTPQQFGAVECSFTAKRLEVAGMLTKNKTFLNQLMNSIMFDIATTVNAVTYIKTLPCVSPFEIVEGVGCISLINNDKDFESASVDCPVGSEPVVLASDNAVRRLNKYLLATAGSNKKYWLGITKDGDENWKWNDGRHITSTAGVYPWRTIEPNGGNSENCACFETENTEKFGLVDVDCTYTLSIICELK